MVYKFNVISLLVASSLAYSNLAYSNQLNCPCKVVKITDGDTVHVLDQSKARYKIRLGGILEAWGIKKDLNVGTFSQQTGEYLQYHSESVFENNGLGKGAN
jgi:hypothetical protein